MINESRVLGGFSVIDPGDAKAFHGDTLDLEVTEEEGKGLTLHLATGRRTLTHPKPDHETATSTILNVRVDDVDEALDALAARGLRFEQYEGDLKTDEKGICRDASPGQSPSIAWFKDSAGSILSPLQ